MKTFIATALFVLFASCSAHAQSGLSVDMNRASLIWQWSQGTGGIVETFEVKCGNAPGSYSNVTAIANPDARSIPVSQAIKGSGQWYCAVAAVNKYGSSPNSNETGFDAGAVPSLPTNLGVLVQ